MPTRSRSHQLEDISINKFQACLPDSWVCRVKDKDYGVDLEIEIFADDGSSTGLMFFAQLKATDDISAKQSVSMKVDRLNYLSSLDTPSMLVRYCDVSEEFYFMWITNVFVQIGEPTTQTVTVKFSESDIWTKEVAGSIPTTVRVLRTIRSDTRRTPIGLTVELNDQTDNSGFELQLAVSKLQNMSNCILNSSNPDACLPVKLAVYGDTLVAKIDVISTIGWKLDEITADEILPRLTYTLARMAGGYEFSLQANDLIRIIQKQGYTVNSREIASRVASLAINAPDVAAELASTNSIHARQDLAFIMYIDSLLSSELDLSARKGAIERFYSEAILEHEPFDELSTSSLHYSLANFQLQWGDYKTAVRHYNSARRLNPSYLQRPYFLAELASCLYFSKKYKASAALYIGAQGLDPTPQHSICVGDALLYSGHFEVASKYYRALADEQSDQLNASEASLKVWLTEWAAMFFNGNLDGQTALLSDRRVWLSVIDQALDEGAFEVALGAALMEAFRVDDDEKLWADAMSFACNSAKPDLIGGTFSAAIWRCGFEVYALFRENLTKSEMPEEAILHFDQLAAAFNEMRPSRFEGGVTTRLIGGNHFDTIQEIESK